MGRTIAEIVGVVAVIAVAYFAPFLVPAFLTAAIGASAALAVTTAVLSIAVGLALSLGFKALGVGAPSAKDAVGPPQVFRQAISNSFIVYGLRRCGGLLVFYHSKQDAGGGHYRYFVIAVAGHRCKQEDQWRLGDEIVTVDGSGMVTSGKYANNAWLWFVRGTATDAAHATFVAECDGKWTTAHQGKGVAKIYAKFKLIDAVVQAGMPNMTADIEGRDEILDPRDATLKYTDNGALVFYDFKKIPREEGGFGAYADEIPDDTWISAQANVCDEVVDGIPRYRLDGVIQTGAAPSEIRDALVVNLAGTYAYSAGKHLMRPGYWIPSSGVLSENDLSGPIQVSAFLSSDAAATEVQGTFVDPSTGYQGAPFPTWTRVPAAADVRQLDLDLAFTTYLKQAARVAAIMGKRAECEKSVVWTMNIAGIKVRAMDTWQLGTARYGLDNYAWVANNWGLSNDYGVVISFREENSDIYADPVLVVPGAPPTIQQPAGPVLTLDEIQQALRNTFAKSGFTPTAIDAGTSATIKLHGLTTTDSFTIDYPGNVTDPTIAPLDLTGLAYSTTFYVYGEVSASVGPGDPAPTFGATAVYGDAINSTAHPYRFYLWRTVTTPASGGVTTTGGGGGFGGGGGGGGGGSGPYP